MVARDGTVKILDFGLAKPFGEAASGELATEPLEDVDGHRRRHRELHVPRAGAGARRGLPLRPVLLRPHPLRGPGRQEGVRQGERRPDAHGDHRGGARASRAPQPEGPAPSRVDRRALPLEGARGALRRDARPRPRAEAGAGQPRPPDRGGPARRRRRPGRCRSAPRRSARAPPLPGATVTARRPSPPQLRRAARTGPRGSSPRRSARSRSSGAAPVLGWWLRRPQGPRRPPSGAATSSSGTRPRSSPPASRPTGRRSRS